MTEQPPAPLTRRELRLAQQAGVPAHRRMPVTPVPLVPSVTAEQAPAWPTRRELRLADKQQCRRRPVTVGPWTWSGAAQAMTPRLAPVAASVVIVGLLGSGAAMAQADHSTRVQQQAEQDARTALAEQRQLVLLAEEERRGRVDEADASRMTGQAAAFASTRRAEAIAVAQAAVEAAGSTVALAADVVDPQTLAELDEAVAELNELIAAAPAVDEPDATDPAQAPTGESSDVPGDEAPGSEPTTEPGVPVDEDGEDAARSEDLPRDPAVADDVPDAEDLGVTLRMTGTSRGSTLRTEAPQDEDAAELEGTSPLALLAQLDIEVSDKMLEAAQRVVDLSTELEASAAELIAEAEEQAAVAAELERKIRVADGSPNGRIPADVLCGVDFAPDARMRCDAAEALEELNEAYRAHFGTDLRIVSSYRSYEGQVRTKETRGSLAATPGTSNHGRGLAVDFGGFGGLGNFDTANYRWMRANSERFGWFHPRIMQPGGGGPQEPWHWEFGTR